MSDGAAVHDGGMPTLRDVRSESDRPRERLARVGAAGLSNRELVALLLGTGHRSRPVLDVAGHLVARGLRDLAGRSLVDVERERGVGRAKAARLLAAIELGARVASEPKPVAPA